MDEIVRALIWRRFAEGGQWRTCNETVWEDCIKIKTGEYRRGYSGYQEFISWKTLAFIDIEKALESIHSKKLEKDSHEVRSIFIGT